MNEAFGAPLPDDLIDFLRRHDGMNASSWAPEDQPEGFPYGLRDEYPNGIKSVAMLDDAIDQSAELAGSLAPDGILPFDDTYGYEPLIQTALVLDPGLVIPGLDGEAGHGTVAKGRSRGLTDPLIS